MSDESNGVLRVIAGDEAALRIIVRQQRKEIDTLAAKVERLTAERDAAVAHIAGWCVAVDMVGTHWDDWDEWYKGAADGKGDALSEIRDLLVAAIAKAKKQHEEQGW